MQAVSPLITLKCCKIYLDIAEMAETGLMNDCPKSALTFHNAEACAIKLLVDICELVCA